MTTPQAVWTSRIESLVKHANFLRTNKFIMPINYPWNSGDPNIQITDDDIYDQLLRCYIQFVSEHLTNYFYNNFYLPVSSPQFPSTPADLYPRTHVMRVSLDQAAFDLSLIERIISQRRATLPKMLKIADFLAMEALQPAISYNLFERPPAVITYYQKSTDIRLIPYGNFALIGLPYSIETTPRDLLAIPHEVGHYVFWHGNGCRNRSWVPNTQESNFFLRELQLIENKDIDINYSDEKYPITEYQKEQQKIYLGKEPNEKKDFLDEVLMLDSAFYNWQEEIFADVYGTLVAGPLISLDFQDLLLENDKRGFKRDDGEHPIPVIRPYIYHETLSLTHTTQSQVFAKEHMSGKEWHEILNTESQIGWNKRLQDRGLSGGEKFKIKVDPEKFLSATFLDQSESIIERWESKAPQQKYSAQQLKEKCEEIVKIIVRDSPLANLSFTGTFWADLFDGQSKDMGQLYHIFETNSLVTSGIPSSLSIAQPSIVPKPHADLENNWLTNYPADSNRPAWLPVFKAAGWTLKGPSTVHTPPPQVY